MKKIINSILILFSVLSVKAEKKPNVIIVLSDDQGYGDFSCHGNPILKTPALDRLHDESIRFGNFHVAPLSTPTRGQLMTGLDAMNNKASTVLSGCCMMRRDLVTMPQIFSQNGYKTGIFGKWHLGDNYPDRPMDRGFDKSLWIKGWGLLSEIEFDNDYYKTRYIDSLTIKLSDKYCTDLWFDKAIEWMDEMNNKGETFFAYISLNAPHGPFHAPREDYLSYCSNLDQKTASFFGMIQNIDKNMDRLDKWLESKSLKNNTIVIFMNDNGTAGGADVYNANMRGEKGSIYDGGHRAACFIRWPGGNLGEPRTIQYASHIQDLLPTCIDLLDLDASSVDYEFDGISLMPAINDTNVDFERMFVVQQGSHVTPSKYNGSVVYNQWRLVGQNELYDISVDPGQQTNVAQANLTVRDKMRAFYENWWSKIYDPQAKQIPLVVGSQYENPVILTSADWVGSGPNTQWGVAVANDDVNGYWVIDAKADGKYRIELSRWPFHINRSLVVSGPSVSIGGTSIRNGKGLPIDAGYISINNTNPVKSTATTNATKITFETNLSAGVNTLKAYFADAGGQYICGAYYVRIEKIP